MEAFLKGVPAFLSEGDLEKELKPFMKKLNIVNWSCEKPRKKNYAWLRFLLEKDGKLFLRHHGQQDKPKPKPGQQKPGRPQPTSRLKILSSHVNVEESKKTITDLEMSHLKHKQEEYLRAPRPSQPTKSAPLGMAISQIAIGKTFLRRAEQDFAFAQQSHVFVDGVGRFGNHSFTANFKSGVRIDVPRSTIVHIVYEPAYRVDSPLSFFMILSQPPLFFEQRDVFSAPKWERHTSISKWPNHQDYISHCLVYRFTVDRSAFWKALARGDLYNLVRTSKYLPVLARPIPYLEDYSTCMSAFEGKLQALGSARDPLLPYPLLFLAQSSVWGNYLHPAAGLELLRAMERVAALPSSRGKGGSLPLTTDSIKPFLRMYPYAVPGIEPAELDPELIVSRAIEREMELRQQEGGRSTVYGPTLPRHQAWVFKAVVTPTRIVLQGPDAESMNRVLRMFSDRTDRFLRVTFSDEDGQDLSLNPNVSNDNVFERFHKVLRQGIQIVGQRFSFLGFSHSSLRSHSAWFSTPFVDSKMQRQTYDTILSTLGDFRDIRVPAKCAARIGQAFSETPYAVDIFEARIQKRTIDDVKFPDGSRIFSDGVGTISRNALEKVWNALPRRLSGATCIQIRWGGIKGMLSLDPHLRGSVICIREETMKKFPSRDMKCLGICDVANRPLRLVLNRQLIKIMEDMGTPNSWFFDLQNKALNVLRHVTASTRNTSTFLGYQDIGTIAGLPGLIKALDAMGNNYRRDRFLRSVVEHVVLRELRLLKHKARIPVSKGVTLFGVMDETGFLGPNEVYVTFERPKKGAGHHIECDSLRDGDVIVTRCPALHPGDVQVARMVRPPTGHPLRQLKNCIVFSQIGTRDLPSQLSGGDLDGDLYNVIWDPKALPSFSFPPADYLRMAPEELDRPVNREDIADFFMNFMKTDILGLIANRHQILADILADGTCADLCIRLAMMHSTAVDYSKTGIPVNPRLMPRAPRTRPDFMAPAPPLQLHEAGEIADIGDTALYQDDEDDGDGLGRGMQRYHLSTKILGQLYRAVDEKQIWSEDIHRQVKPGPSVWEVLLRHTQLELEMEGIDVAPWQYEDEALKIRKLYEQSVSDNIWEFSESPRTCLDEVEFFCGSILNKNSSQTRRQRDLSIKLKEEADRTMAWTVKLMRERGAVGKSSLFRSKNEVDYLKDEKDSDDDDDDDDDYDFDDDSDYDYDDSDYIHDDGDDDNFDGIGIGLGGWQSMPVAERLHHLHQLRKMNKVLKQTEKSIEVLKLCWTCVSVGMHGSEGGSETAGDSFRVVAASCLVREMNAFMPGGWRWHHCLDLPGWS